MDFPGITLFAFILAMIIIVGFHEFGHYITARLCGVKVLEFSIGFGPKLLAWKSKRSGIEYKIEAFPLGGYVKMLNKQEIDDNPEKYSKDESAKSFDNASLWKRFLIVFNGPSFNLILAIFFFAMVNMQDKTIPHAIVGQTTGIAAQAGIQYGDKITSIGEDSIENWRDVAMSLAKESSRGNIPITFIRGSSELESKIDLTTLSINRETKDLLGSVGIVPIIASQKNIVKEVIEGSAAEKAGLLPGDKILSANGINIEFFRDSAKFIKQNPEKEVSLEVIRNGQPISLNATIGFSEKGGEKTGVLGYVIQPGERNPDWFFKESLSFGDSVLKGFSDSWQMTTTTVAFLGKLITGEINTNAISGPVGIAKAAGSSAQSGLIPFLTLIAFLSINLMIMNLLPIPGLDGGHLAMYAYESIFGPVPEKAQSVLTRIGVGLLLALMAYAIGLDILDIF